MINSRNEPQIAIPTLQNSRNNSKIQRQRLSLLRFKSLINSSRKIKSILSMMGISCSSSMNVIVHSLGICTSLSLKLSRNTIFLALQGLLFLQRILLVVDIQIFVQLSKLLVTSSIPIRSSMLSQIRMFSPSIFILL